VSRFLNAPLDELCVRDREQLYLSAFVIAGGCTFFGTLACIECPLDVALAECNPPDDCPACPARECCPCGCDEFRRALMVERAEAVTTH
jgi:hypothetical protein